TLRNTVVANSVSGGDCSGTVNITTNNLIEDGSCSATLSGDPLLLPLDNYGGPTLTMSPAPGSPLLEAGDNATCEATDQRGVARPVGNTCDIGAVETGAELKLKKTASVPLTPADVVTFTLTLSNTGILTETAAALSDALPDGFDFAAWVQQPAGALHADNTVTWSGELAPGASVTIVFQVSISGSYGQQVANTGLFTGTFNYGSASANVSVPACENGYTVTNEDDSGVGSLRYGIGVLCPGKTINFAGDASIFLDSVLSINNELTIDGSGHDVIISGDSGNDGSRNVQVFNIGSSGVVTLSHLSVISGTATNGGGIGNSGILVVQDSLLQDNQAAFGGAIYSLAATLTILDSVLQENTVSREGGAVFAKESTLTVQRTLIQSNQAKEFGGGIETQSTQSTVTDSIFTDNHAIDYSSGGFENWLGSAIISSSTFYGNSAKNYGGAIANFGNNGASLTVNNSTFVDNQSTSGGAISSNQT
ncbi:MAG: DUF11 domain-containing protein, partial [Caldilineaceae bacterium]|nr:DUF11 domain-containing protein [Caldilineaceae bacterium]